MTMNMKIRRKVPIKQYPVSLMSAIWDLNVHCHISRSVIKSCCVIMWCSVTHVTCHCHWWQWRLENVKKMDPIHYHMTSEEWCLHQQVSYLHFMSQFHICEYTCTCCHTYMYTHMFMMSSHWCQRRWQQ